jgi:conjugative relaxase-like TrwC/TraI family protein
MKSRIRTIVGQAMFAQANGHEPNERELAGFIAQQSRLGSKAVAGFDLTFSPVKSVSALWALAPLEVAREVEAAHRAAVEDTISWLEQMATFTRLGHNGVRQVETRGLIAAAFVHRSSRAGDPDLHTHVAVSNKVQTLDGRWRALDGRVLFKATVAASERYNTLLEAELRERLGVEFVDVARPGRRPVREIAGIDPRLLVMWSQRRAVIDARRAELAASFQAEHHRPPTPQEAIELAQQATLETRPAKHDTPAESEQRSFWRRQADTLLGAGHVTSMLDRALGHSNSTRSLSEHQVWELAQRVIDRVETDRATWQCWHVIAEAQRTVRSVGLRPRTVRAAVNAVVACALEERSITLSRSDVHGVPEPLRRSDGSSVYTVAGSQLYTPRALLDAEQALLDAAGRVDGRRANEPAIEMALLETIANGLVLNDGQARFMRELATSGARVQLALAPAGTGKTTALRVLARAWREDAGDVIGLAPSAAAARLLGQAIDAPAETLAKVLHDLGHGELKFAKHTLVLVDEAGMASTPDLARLVAHALEAGASVRLVGDDRQLAAIGAGGILRDFAETAAAVTLDEAVRFTDPAEASAALAIRDGSPAGLDFYLAQQRVHLGDETTAPLSAYTAWAADRASGHDALLVAATRGQVTALNTKARTDRLAAADPRSGAEVQLVDGTHLSAGDEMITRRNERRLQITPTDWVKNGDRFTVRAVHEDGTVTATHRDTGRHVTLPAGYVAEHVALGYAVTIHGAQGATADTCHTVLTGRESREQLYVALSRGRHANHLHIALPGAADEHAAIRRDTLIPPTASELLLRILEHESAQHSATTQQRRLDNPSRRLREAVDRYIDSLTSAPADPALPPLSPPPLPWLPPVPAVTGPWRDYLTARARRITEVADDVVDRMIRTQMPGAVPNRRDWYYQSHHALWRAVHPEIEPRDDLDVTNPHLTRREAAYARHLAGRWRDVRAPGRRETEERWAELITAIDPQAIHSPEWPALAKALQLGFALKLEVDRLTPQLLHRRTRGEAVRLLLDLVEERYDESHRRGAVAQRTFAPTHVEHRIESPSVDRPLGI